MKLGSAACIFVLLFFLSPSAWGGSYLLETASINPAASPFGGLVAGSVPFNQTQFLGARFSLTETTQLHQVGGHMIGNHGPDILGQTVLRPGSGFLAIFPLLNAHSFPTVDANTFESQALFSTLITPGIPRLDHSVSLSLFLSPGEYAVIFGGSSGRERDWFGSDGDLFFGTDILNPSASLFSGHVRRSSSTISWNDSTAQTFGPRIFISGSPVPEPSTFVLFASGIIGLLTYRRLRPPEDTTTDDVPL